MKKINYREKSHKKENQNTAFKQKNEPPWKMIRFMRRTGLEPAQLSP